MINCGDIVRSYTDGSFWEVSDIMAIDDEVFIKMYKVIDSELFTYYGTLEDFYNQYMIVK